MLKHARPRLKRTSLVGVLAAAALTAGVTPALAGNIPAGAPAALGTAAGAQAQNPLPFDLPAPSVLRSTAKKVFAHYFPSLPISLDNQPPATDYYARNYLTPGGENGVHAAYGGFIRNRPPGRAPLTGDWKLQDMKTEVQRAAAAGLDGFTVDVMQVPVNGYVPKLWENARLLLQAASEVDPGFKVMLMPDVSGSLADKDPGTLAAGMKGLATYSSAYRLADGRLVISPFKGEAHPASWWRTFMDIMQNKYHERVALLPVFVGSEQKYAAEFRPISYGMSSWGSRNPAWNDPTTTGAGSPRARAAAIKAIGEEWMQPVSVQDERPDQSLYDEAENTTNLRDTWALARATNADLVQIPTWNDFSEGAEVGPTEASGWSFVDLQSYYLTWYKTGVAPTIKRDTVYLTHRKQPVAARPAFPQTKLMQLRGGSPARDTVEALTFMTAPGTATITVGTKQYSCTVPAGVGVCTVPLGLGAVAATVSRNGAPTASVVSKFVVTNTPYVQDLGYIGASSGRTPGPVAGGGVSVQKQTVTVPASADTVARAEAPARNYGKDDALAVRGATGAISYLGFAVPAAPAGTTLTSASLQLRTLDTLPAGTSTPGTISLVSGRWSETGLTWSNRPALGAPATTLPGALTAARTYATPLTASTVKALSTGLTLALTGTGGPTQLLGRFWSREAANAGYAPKLVLTYTAGQAASSDNNAVLVQATA